MAEMNLGYWIFGSLALVLSWFSLWSAKEAWDYGDPLRYVAVYSLLALCTPIAVLVIAIL
jgi:hypothetical protein